MKNLTVASVSLLNNEMKMNSNMVSGDLSNRFLINGYLRVGLRVT